MFYRTVQVRGMYRTVQVRGMFYRTVQVRGDVLQNDSSKGGCFTERFKQGKMFYRTVQVRGDVLQILPDPSQPLTKFKSLFGMMLKFVHVKTMFKTI